MIHRTIAAALLLGLASQVLAGEFVSPAYDQAAGMAAGRNADATYDGSAARTAVQAQVDGAVATGGLAVETSPAAVTPASRPALTAAAVPEPAKAPAKGKFFSGRSLLFGAGGAAVGAGVGWFLGGPIGAVVGALAGFAIGFLLSKILPKLQPERRIRYFARRPAQWAGLLSLWERRSEPFVSSGRMNCVFLLTTPIAAVISIKIAPRPGIPGERTT